MADFSVGVVGLGSIGAPVARRLNRQGIPALVTDPHPQTMQYYMAQGGANPAGTPYNLAQMCNLVILALQDDATLREAVTGVNGIQHGLKPGTIVVDLTSGDPELGPALSRGLVSRGVRWVEAAAIGDRRSAIDGKLTLLLGGQADVIEQVSPVLRLLAANILHIGAIGSGAAARALGSLAGMLSLAAFAEVLIIGKRAGMNPDALLKAFDIFGGLSASPPPALVDQALTGNFDSGHALGRMQGDIGRALALARENGTPAPLTSLVQAFAAAALLRNEGGGDATDLVRYMADQAQTDLTVAPAPTV